MKTCKRAHYWGTVQGVGFRATTQWIAHQHGVAGFVRNLPNGQVEVVVVGAAAEVERFLAGIEARLASFIEGHNIQDEPCRTFVGFEIRS